MRREMMMNSIHEFLQLLGLYKSRVRTRQALLKLNSHQLKDIRITREQAIDEASRPFWSGNSLFFEDSLKKCKSDGMKQFVCAYPKNTHTVTLRA